MSKKNIEVKTYTEWELNNIAESVVNAAHNALAREEHRIGKRCYETFGEWCKLNPNHPVAKMNYPKDEYVMVISNYKEYFDKKCAAKVAPSLDIPEI